MVKDLLDGKMGTSISVGMKMIKNTGRAKLDIKMEIHFKGSGWTIKKRAKEFLLKLMEINL